jgi:hypothetical protein
MWDTDTSISNYRPINDAPVAATIVPAFQTKVFYIAGAVTSFFFLMNLFLMLWGETWHCAVDTEYAEDSTRFHARVFFESVFTLVALIRIAFQLSALFRLERLHPVFARFERGRESAWFHSLQAMWVVLMVAAFLAYTFYISHAHKDSCPQLHSLMKIRYLFMLSQSGSTLLSRKFKNPGVERCMQVFEFCLATWNLSLVVSGVAAEMAHYSHGQGHDDKIICDNAKSWNADLTQAVFVMYHAYSFLHLLHKSTVSKKDAHEANHGDGPWDKRQTFVLKRDLRFAVVLVILCVLGCLLYFVVGLVSCDIDSVGVMVFRIILYISALACWVLVVYSFRSKVSFFGLSTSDAVEVEGLIQPHLFHGHAHKTIYALFFVSNAVSNVMMATSLTQQPVYLKDGSTKMRTDYFIASHVVWSAFTLFFCWSVLALDTGAGFHFWKDPSVNPKLKGLVKYCAAFTSIVLVTQTMVDILAGTYSTFYAPRRMFSTFFVMFYPLSVDFLIESADFALLMVIKSHAAEQHTKT